MNHHQEAAMADKSPLRHRPQAYFITFRTYGSWLHGDPRGSVTRKWNEPETPFIEADDEWENHRRKSMVHPPYVMDMPARQVVTRTICDVCHYRGWLIHELNVRTNHVHLVVNSQDTPERVMTDLKAYATRRMREANLVTRDRAIWSRHGSTRYLWDEKSVASACEYVREGQDKKTLGPFSPTSGPTARSEPRP
ncbi:MAG: transposase [Phycisphaerales bacterium]|nr:transposase [Phycisphaerales bacterium]MCB9864515.1 transposase [Phycisphaerales bacterium]